MNVRGQMLGEWRWGNGDCAEVTWLQGIGVKRAESHACRTAETDASTTEDEGERRVITKKEGVEN